MQQYCRCRRRSRSPPRFFSNQVANRPGCPGLRLRTRVILMTRSLRSIRHAARARFSETWQELRARRAGRQGMSTGIARATRDVTGPTGWVFSNAWQQLDDHGDAYMKSFDRRIPPSIFISERDRKRHGQPIPVAERCLEDAGPEAGPKPQAGLLTTRTVPEVGSAGSGS